MNPPNKKTLLVKGLPQPVKRQAARAPQIKPVVVQPKTAVSAQNVKRPIAPPVYRPRLIQEAVQPKVATGAVNRKPPVAPPAYRPQQAPKVLQKKSVTTQLPHTNQVPRQPVAPPVYDPAAKTPIQPKTISQLRTPPTPPPVYRPKQEKIAQLKLASAARTQTLPKTTPVYRPQPTVSRSVMHPTVSSSGQPNSELPGRGSCVELPFGQPAQMRAGTLSAFSSFLIQTIALQSKLSPYRASLDPRLNLKAPAQVLQRTVVLGPPGLNTVTYGPNDTAVLLQQNYPQGVVGWRIPWLQPHLTTIAQGAPLHTFDTFADLVWWVVLRELMDELLNLVRSPNPLPSDTKGRAIQKAHAVIDQQRQLFQTAGSNNGTFQFLGRTYFLTNAGQNHYYAERPKGHNIEYHGLIRGQAKKIMKALLASDMPNVEDKDVDDFVCAFFAETTRWPVEQLFNLFSLSGKKDDNDVLTGSASPHSLPMAAGSTWDPLLQSIGRETPKRAVNHARSEGLMVTIEQEFTDTNITNFPQFVAAMRDQLGM